MSNRHFNMARQLNRGTSPTGGVGVSGPWQWGTVHAVNIAAGTVDVYLDNNSLGANPLVTAGIPYLASYQPVVGDAVFIGRQQGASRTSRVVLGNLGPNIPLYPDTNANGIFANGATIIAGVAGKNIYLFAAQVYAAAADVAQIDDGTITVKLVYGAGANAMGHDSWPTPIKFGLGTSVKYNAVGVNQNLTVNLSYTIA